jgi:hypothetical protein
MKTVHELQSQYDKVSELDMPEVEKNDTLEAIEGEIELAVENERTLNELMPIENVDAIALFKDTKTLQSLLDEIATTARSIEFDVNTPAGRKIGISAAHKVSRSKVVIVDAGKSLTVDIAKQKKDIDDGRRLVREFCDALRDEIRKPITDWENAEAKKEADKKFRKKYETDYLEAVARDDLINREAKVQADIARLEAERIERERVEREKQDTIDREKREEQIRKDAAEDADRRAKKAEDDRIAAADKAIKDAARAAEAAHAAQQAAVEREQRRAKDEADAKERDRLRLIAGNERQAQARAADRENRRKVNIAIVKALVAGGVTEKGARTVVELVAKGNIPSMSIRY